VSQKGKTNLDFTEERDSEWQRHQLGHMQVSTSLQTDNHTNTSPLSFLQAGCPSCRPTNSVKALKAYITLTLKKINILKKVFLTLMVYSQEESCVESSWSDCGINIFFGSIGFLCFAAAAFATQHFIGWHNGGLCTINKVSSKNI